MANATRPIGASSRSTTTSRRSRRRRQRRRSFKTGCLSREGGDRPMPRAVLLAAPRSDFVAHDRSRDRSRRRRMARAKPLVSAHSARSTTCRFSKIAARRWARAIRIRTARSGRRTAFRTKPPRNWRGRAHIWRRTDPVSSATIWRLKQSLRRADRLPQRTFRCARAVLGDLAVRDDGARDKAYRLFRRSYRGRGAGGSPTSFVG